MCQTFANPFPGRRLFRGHESIAAAGGSTIRNPFEFLDAGVLNALHLAVHRIGLDEQASRAAACWGPRRCLTGRRLRLGLPRQRGHAGRGKGQRCGFQKIATARRVVDLSGDKIFLTQANLLSHWFLRAKKTAGLCSAVLLESNTESLRYLNFTRKVIPKVRGAPR